VAADEAADKDSVWATGVVEEEEKVQAATDLSVTVEVTDALTSSRPVASLLPAMGCGSASPPRRAGETQLYEDTGLPAQQLAPTTAADIGLKRRKLPKEFAKPVTRKLAADYQAAAKYDLDKGATWKFKTFTLFPILAYLRYMDFVFRVIFPVAYLAFTVAMLAEVGFGYDQFALLDTAPCYREALGL